jgi:hypothetical protein
MTTMTTNRFPPVNESGVDLILTRAVREELLRHKKLGNTIAGWQDGQVVDVPPEEIGDDWEFIPGLPDELNPPIAKPLAHAAGNGHAHPDRFLRGLLVGSGLAAVVALLVPRD